MPWKPSDETTFVNLNTKSGLVFDIRDSEFGAVPGTECRDAIQAAIDQASSTGGRVRITQGTYFIAKPLQVPSNCTIEWDAGAKIVASPTFDPTINDSVRGGMLVIAGSENVRLINPQLDGNKAAFHANFPEGRFMGIFGRSALRVQIIGGSIANMPSNFDAFGRPQNLGDAIYLGDLEDNGQPCIQWTISGTEVFNCDRNGVSFVSAKHSVINGVFAHDNGYAGIDVEPDKANDVAFGLHVQNCIMVQNRFYGLAIGPSGFAVGTGNHGSIVVIGNTLEFNRGLTLGNEFGSALAVHEFDLIQFVGNVIRANGENPPNGLGIVVRKSKGVTFVANLVLQHAQAIKLIETETPVYVGNTGLP